MIVLDTDHLTVLRYPENPQCSRLAERMRTSREEFATSIVSVEEQLRGWLARINRLKEFRDQVAAYGELNDLFRFFKEWKIVDFELPDANEARRLRREKIRIGSMDLKIASIALTHDALLLSANLSDFRKVPNLRVENWLAE